MTILSALAWPVVALVSMSAYTALIIWLTTAGRDLQWRTFIHPNNREDHIAPDGRTFDGRKA